MTSEESRDSEEESEYMIPSSRPVLPPITAPLVVESQPVLRHPQPQPLLSLQTQNQASAHNSRYSKTLCESTEITLAIGVILFVTISVIVGCCYRLPLELEDGPQMYEAMYNIQSRSQQARDSGILLSILNLYATFIQTCHDFSL